MRDYLRIFALACFNPLFIGEPAKQAPLAPAIVAEMGKRFNPLFIGEPAKPRRNRHRELEEMMIRSFNPLFIGEPAKPVADERPS